MPDSGDLERATAQAIRHAKCHITRISTSTREPILALRARSTRSVERRMMRIAIRSAEQHNDIALRIGGLQCARQHVCVAASRRILVVVLPVGHPLLKRMSKRRPAVSLKALANEDFAAADAAASAQPGSRTMTASFRQKR
jgi:hypothetical protein